MEIIDIISGYGFPIALSIFLLVKMIPTLEGNTRALNMLATIILNQQNFDLESYKGIINRSDSSYE